MRRGPRATDSNDEACPSTGLDRPASSVGCPGPFVFAACADRGSGPGAARGGRALRSASASEGEAASSLSRMRGSGCGAAPVRMAREAGADPRGTAPGMSRFMCRLKVSMSDEGTDSCGRGGSKAGPPRSLSCCASSHADADVGSRCAGFASPDRAKSACGRTSSDARKELARVLAACSGAVTGCGGAGVAGRGPRTTLNPRIDASSSEPK